MAECRLHGLQRVLGVNAPYRQLPDTTRRLHRRYRTPYIGIVVFAGFACIALLPGQADFLGKIYAFGAMLSFSTAHLSLTWPRISEPEQRSLGRPRMRGDELPPLTADGLTGTVLSFVVVSVPDLKVAIAGVTWRALGMGGYVVSRLSQGRRGVIELARMQGGRRVSGHVERVRPGASGRLIVDEARELRAHALVMALPPRTSTTLFGKTVETVLADRPCRVIIESEPTHA